MIALNNATINFQDAPIRSRKEVDFTVLVSGDNNTIRNLKIDGGFDYSGEKTAPSNSPRNEGVRVNGEGNTFENPSVANFRNGTFSDAFHVLGDNTTINRPFVENPGNAAFRTSNAENAIVNSPVVRFTADTLGWTYGSLTRPRFVIGTGPQPTNNLTFNDIDFRSDGAWAYSVIDSDLPGRLENFTINGGVIDQRNAEFHPDVGTLQRSIWKFDNVSNVTVKDLTILHGKDNVMDMFFVNVGSFTGQRLTFDGFFCQVGAESSVHSMELVDVSIGVNGKIPWVIGRTATAYDVDMETFTARNFTASNLETGAPGWSNVTNAAIWAKTIEPSKWDLSGTTINRLTPGIEIQLNENASLVQ